MAELFEVSSLDEIESEIMGKMMEEGIDYLYRVFKRAHPELPAKKYMDILKNHIVLIVEDNKLFSEDCMFEDGINRFLELVVADHSFLNFYLRSTKPSNGLMVVDYIYKKLPKEKTIEFLEKINSKHIENYLLNLNIKESIIDVDDIDDILDLPIFTTFFSIDNSSKNFTRFFDYLLEMKEEAIKKFLDVSSEVMTKFKEYKTIPQNFSVYGATEKQNYYDVFSLTVKIHSFWTYYYYNKFSDRVFTKEDFNYLFSSKNPNNIGSVINDDQTFDMYPKIMSFIIYQSTLGFISPRDSISDRSILDFLTSPTISISKNTIKDWTNNEKQNKISMKVFEKLIPHIFCFKLPEDKSMDDILWPVLHRINTMLLVKNSKFSVLTGSLLTRTISGEFTKNNSIRSFALEVLYLGFKRPKSQRCIDFYEDDFQKTYFPISAMKFYCDVEFDYIRFKMKVRKQILDFFKILAIMEPEQKFTEHINNVVDRKKIVAMKFVNFLARDYVVYLDEFNKIGDEIIAEENIQKKNQLKANLVVYLKALIMMINTFSIYISDRYPKLMKLFLTEELTLNFCDSINALIGDFIVTKKGNLEYLSDRNKHDTDIARTFYSLICHILLLINKFAENEQFIKRICMTIELNTVFKNEIKDVEELKDIISSESTLLKAIELVMVYNYEHLNDLDKARLSILKSQVSESLIKVYLKKMDDIPEDEYPDDFKDPIMLSVIEKPIAVPIGSHRMISDACTIRRHLLNKDENPFDRSKLTIESLELFNSKPDVISEIEAFNEKRCAWIKDYKEKKD